MKLSVNEAKLTGLRCRIQTLMGGWGEAVIKKFFSALLASVWSKNKAEGEGGAVGPSGSATGFLSSQLGTVLLFNKF